MPKITDENYLIKTVHATEWFDVLATGTTEPMLVLALEAESGDRDSYVVKPFGHPRIYPQAVMKECLGAWIALELGLHTFEPVFIEVSSAFTDTLLGNPYYQRFADSIGLNFGSKYVPGTIPVVGHNCLSRIQVSQAEQVTSFDLFISNPDRREEKPNLLTVQSDLYVFDHELAFDFMLMLSFNRNPRPWELGEMELAMLRKHFLYPKLRGTQIQIRDFIERFERLDVNFWTKASNLLPTTWLSHDLITIKNHLALIIENRAIFARQLTQAILA
ncbi:MAG: hypothetical protein BGO21_18390 [Dyadobacter sp. 50-39]|uniref:HipA family kinase n=1 Tax=Dyadobacter sp. 50-39 TaxID=1895756 RepID=UPI00095CFA71|nr:HipA family kinase [Dyadobacter sp. 50-39]OJV14672.1 MAG: hypothetical protein BGO21_18390 [Dyadobacter sp. 50-39]